MDFALPTLDTGSNIRRQARRLEHVVHQNVHGTAFQETKVLENLVAH